jgi:hypothetical protein
MNEQGAKNLALAIIENCVAHFPIFDRHHPNSNQTIGEIYTIKCMFVESSPLIQMVADVIGYDEKKFRDGLRARLEKEFYYTMASNSRLTLKNK